MGEASHEELFRCLFAESNDAFVIFRPHDLVVVDANPTAQRLTARRKRQLVGAVLSELVAAEDAQSLEKLVEACRKTSFFHAREGYRLLRSAGEPLIVNISISRIHVEPEPLGLAVVRDVTERRQAEDLARLLQSELARILRIAALGEMAAALAHEVNQPLCGIANDVGACKHLLGGETPIDAGELSRILEGIGAAALRASEIVERMRSFVAKRPPQCDQADVNGLIREVAAMVAPEVRARRAAVRLALSAEPLLAVVDGILIQQVVVNLLTNSLEALDGAPADDRQIEIRTAADEREITVTVADTGPGVGLDQRDHIFEPYRTNKPEGLGIGLSLSRTIVQQHGGRLWLAATAPPGAVFSFTLPRETGPRETGPQETLPPETMSNPDDA